MYPIPRVSPKTGKALKPKVYVWHPCVSCGELTLMPLKLDGSVGRRGVAWDYGRCPFCSKERI